MRVALLSTGYPRFEGDVAGCFVEGFARTLARRGHDVDVIVPESDVPTDERVEPNVRVTRVPYLRPQRWQRTFYGAGVPDNVRSSALAWPGLITFPLALGAKLAARGARYDALVSHFGVPSGLVASRLRGAKPHLAVLHSADVHLLARLPGGRAIARAIAFGASALWFVTHEHRERFERVLGTANPCRVHVGPMGFDPLTASAPRVARPFTVLFVGRLVAVKGLDRAIDAIATIPGAELVVAGDGPERAALEARARAKHASVRFVGAVGPSERDRWLARADAFVLPSRVLSSGRSEGFPVVLLEAAGARLPIVASDVGGVREIFDHERSALLVPADDAGALARSIARLRDDAPLARRLGDEACARVRPFTWPSLGPTIESLLA